MMKQTKFGKLHMIVCLLLSFCLMFVLAACGDEQESNTSKGKITLAPTTISIDAGKDAAIQATLTDISGDVTWTSSNPDVATVKVTNAAATTKVATVTGVAAGTATITATAGGKSATCTVTVKSTGDIGGDEGITIKYNGVVVGTNAYNVRQGGNITFTAAAAEGSAITWETSEPTVATVTNGVVTGVAAGEAVITAKISDTEKATVNVKVYAATEIAFSGESEFSSGWRYWSGDGNAVVASCVEYAELNETVIKYTMSSGQFYSVQLFYKDNLVGIDHDVSLTVVSPIEAKMTVNGVKQELAVGNNQITVENYSGSTLSIQFGVADEFTIMGENLEFVFKNLVVTSNAVGELKAPSFAYDADTKIVTITDTENDSEQVQKYVIGLFADADDEDPAYTVDVVSGEAVALDTVASGTYTAKVKALGVTNVINSDWSESTASVEWVNDKTPLVFKANDDIASGSNTWYVWYRNWDPKATVAEAYIKDGDIYLKGVVSPKQENWDVQLFYKGEEFTKLTVTVTASQAGKITINGVVTDLEAGVAKTIEITSGSPNVSIQLGGGEAANNLQGDVTFSNIMWTVPVVKEALATPTALTIDGNTFTVTPAEGTEDEIEKYEVGFFRDGKLDQSLMITDGTTGTFDIDTLYATEYAVKARAIAKEDAEHKDSDWFVCEETVTGSVELPGTTGTPIEEADNQGAAMGKTNQWSYFIDNGDGLEVDYCTLTGDALGEGNKIELSYSYSGANWTALNLCYPMTAGMPNGYEVKFTFKSSVAGNLTVSGGGEQSFEVVKGENEIVKDFAGALLWLRFGKPGVGPLVGEFEITDIRITQIVAQKLAAPSFEYNSETKVITISDEENGNKALEYKLNFYQAGELKGSATVANGDIVAPAGLAVGEYTAKLVAVGDGTRYTDSDESESSATINVETLNTKTNIKLINNDGEDVNNNKEQWLLWAQSFVSVSEATYDTADNKITITYEYTNENDKPWYSMRLIYRQLNAEKGYFKCTINVQSSGIYMINNVKTELEAGDNEIYVQCLGTDFILVFGEMDKNPGRDAQTVTISNIEFTSTAPPATASVED